MKTGAEEFNLIQQSKNPQSPISTRFVWILSARHTITKQHNNCPTQPITYQAETNTLNAPPACDETDDFERVKLGLQVALNVIKKKAKFLKLKIDDAFMEQHAPYILYNGTSTQNEELKKHLQGGLTKLGLPYYPAGKFIVFDVPPDQVHTGGQLTSLAKLKQQDPRLQPLSEENTEITIVTSAFHLPRVRRYFKSKNFPNPFHQDAHLTFVAVDREFKRPCAINDREGESPRIDRYTETGDIGKPIGGNWYDIESIKAWTPLRMTQQSKTPIITAKTRDDIDVNAKRPGIHFN